MDFLEIFIISAFRKILLIISCLLIASCSFVETIFYMAISPEPVVVDFPLGKKTKRSIELKQKIGKPYAISLGTNFIHYDPKQGERWIDDKLNYPYNISVKIFKVEEDGKKLIIDELLTERSRKLGGGVFGAGGKYSMHIYDFYLPEGEYLFEISDNSEYIPLYDEINNSIRIVVNARIQ
nr:hypothetical protein [Neisseria meningitidis]